MSIIKGAIMLFLIAVFIIELTNGVLNFRTMVDTYQDEKIDSSASESVEQQPAEEIQPLPQPEVDTSAFTYHSHGQASTYGWGEPLNVHTSCGDVFDPMAITVAVPGNFDGSLCGRQVEIQYGQKIIYATINDAGPAIHLGRIIDLSKGAAMELGINHPTTFQVDIRY